MAFNPTKAQKMAINTKGNVLVSAAAGSGKTAVLVERVISLMKDSDSPISADKMLIVTFTNAAAAEMRTRIEKRLDAEIKENPKNKFLIRQKYLLANSKICTIDSFCIELIRENFEKLGISPDFKISDSTALGYIDRRVMLEIVREYIDSKNPIFLRLIDIIGAEYDDNDFVTSALEIFNYSRQLAEPSKWFESLSENFSKEFNQDNVWYNYAFSSANDTIDSLKKALAILIDSISQNEDTANRFLSTLIFISDELLRLDNISKVMDWDKFFNALNSFSIPPKPNSRGLSGIASVASTGTFFDLLKKGIENIKTMFYIDKHSIEEQFDYIREPLELFSNILLRFQEKLLEEYLKENVLTFHNAEHLALELLTKNDSSNEFLERYDVVMVDEYQDTNDLQDRLFEVLSCHEKNLFAVGDIKQSIYGFRGANPDNFLRKKNRYIPIEIAQENEPKKIILSNNFRSNKQICDFVNFFFSKFMTDKTGDIIYNEEEKLVASDKACDFKDAVEWHIIEKNDSEKPSLVLESIAILNYIRKLLNSGEYLNNEDGTKRKIRYSDFAILLRATKNKASVIANVLRSAGVPVNFGVEGFAEKNEIATILSLLKIIDNPRKDIDLACVMLSPIFAITPEELAKMRVECPRGDFYTAVTFSANNGNEQAKAFLKKLEYYRTYAITLSLPKLISFLINDSGYLSMVSAMSEGETRHNNLLLLEDYAREYSSNTNAGIPSFINYIISHSEAGLKSAVSSGGDNAVRIMSIHASKGLQFPICIIANTDTAFNDEHNKTNIVYNSSMGIGFRYYNEAKKKKENTIGYEIIGDIARKTGRNEELRLLYVAMTRAKDRLVLFSTVKNLEKSIENTNKRLLLSNNEISKELFNQTSSYSKWLFLASALHPDIKEIRDISYGIIPDETPSNFKLNIINGENLDYVNHIDLQDNITPDIEIAEQIANNIEFCYPYEKVRNIEAKASVSAIANKAESDRFAFSEQPAFLNNEGITATGRGTAMHKVMQFIDFSKVDNLEDEIDRLCEWQFISENEAKSLNLTALRKFFNSDLFKRIISANKIHREMRFLTEIDASALREEIGESNEKIIVQGAVDLCLVEDNGIVIIDFKTDRVRSKEELLDAYSNQLYYYGIACEKIFGLRVKDKVIYSFALNEAIKA